MTDIDAAPQTLDAAAAVLARLGDRRRELRAREAELQRQINDFAKVDQSDVDARVRAIMRGDHGAAERRSLNRLLEDATGIADQLRLVERAVEAQKAEVATARRRRAREVAAELAEQHDAAVVRIGLALEELLAAQAAERALHDQVRRASGVEGVLPEFGRMPAGVDVLLQRARAHLATKARAAA